MAGVTEQTQQQRGQDRSLGQGSNQSTRSQSSSSRASRSESGQETISESARSSMEGGFEQISTTKQHAEITISFSMELTGMVPGRQYKV